jgi:hypothetical protein
MNESPHSEYLVRSRDRWDKNAAKAGIELAIHEFCAWLERNLDNGRTKSGSRLNTKRAVASRTGIVTDGPFSEAKEFICGGWFTAQASVYNVTNESPGSNPRTTRRKNSRKL